MLFVAGEALFEDFSSRLFKSVELDGLPDTQQSINFAEEILHPENHMLVYLIHTLQMALC